MSASREKKQRQGAGLSEKALQAQQQQAAQKRKTVIYTVIGVVVAVLVAALLIWRTGFFQARATAATLGDTKISAAELSYYYYSAYNTWMNENYYYFYYLGYPIPDENDVMDASTGLTYRDYFLAIALSSAQENFALADTARKNGHTDAEVRDSLNARVKALKAEASSNGSSYSAYLKTIFGPYMSAGVYEKLYTMNLLANLAYNDKGNELLDSYTEADMRAYYEADNHADTLDTYEYSFLYFTPAAVEEKDEDGNARDKDEVAAEKEAALAEAKANAEATKKALEEALEKDPESLKKDGHISDLAEEYELADNSYSDHTSSVGVTSAPATIREKLLSMKDGDVELVENGESGYYVVVLHSRRLVEDPTKDVRHILALAETTTAESGKTVAPTDEAWAAAKAKIEAIKAEYEAGARTEDSFAALANEKSDDGDGTTGGLYPKIGPNDNYVPEFLEWIYPDDGHEVKVGDTGIVQHDAGDATNGYWGYHFMYLVGDNEPVWMRTVRTALTNQDLKTWEDELLANYPAALTSGAGNIGR